jgi:hypothetical protein
MHPAPRAGVSITFEFHSDHSVNETDLELGQRLGFFTVDQLKQANRQIERTGRLLHGLLRAKKIQRLKSVGSTLALFVGPALGLLLLSVLH